MTGIQKHYYLKNNFLLKKIKIRKINRKQNMIKANQLIEDIYLKNKGLLTEELNQDYNYEPKPIGKEGIEKKIAELVRKRNSLEEQRKQITKEIKFLNDEIKKWQTEISPNQLTMFGDI
jgi:hypothetical protein